MKGTTTMADGKSRLHATGGLKMLTRRFSQEGAFLRRLFPVLSAQLNYFIKGVRKNSAYKKEFAHFLSRPSPPWFSHVELETLNRCNGECSFCPVNRKAAQRQLARMPESLFEDILRQLAEIRYKRGVSLFSNNEPLLDTRLPDFAAMARKRLPGATIKLYTNGTLLTLDLFRRLIPNFNKFTVNNYNPAPEMHGNIQEIHNFCLTEEGQKLIAGKNVRIQLRNPESVLGTRAGTAPNRERLKKSVRALCAYPFRQFIVRPDGRISLCCNDALGQMTLGDLMHESMADIWRGKISSHVRERMVEKGRAGIPLCARCDFVSY